MAFESAASLPAAALGIRLIGMGKRVLRRLLKVVGAGGGGVGGGGGGGVCGSVAVVGRRDCKSGMGNSLMAQLQVK